MQRHAGEGLLAGGDDLRDVGVVITDVDEVAGGAVESGHGDAETDCGGDDADTFRGGCDEGPCEALTTGPVPAHQDVPGWMGRPPGPRPLPHQDGSYG
jgi:hypothetical protein